MIYVNGKKFACESCIKGHRSSSCAHNDRPLLEVKKKGRPVSQCDTCRQLRKSKKFHSKCNCSSKDIGASEPRAQSSAINSASEHGGRLLPIAPAPPNGKVPVSASPIRANAGERAASLGFRPCICKNPQECKCLSAPSTSFLPPRPPDAASNDNLETLATAAAMCCSSRSRPSTSRPAKAPSTEASSSRRTPMSTMHARANAALLPTPLPEPYAPPLLAPPTAFPIMSPMNATTAITGSGCTCGLQCKCPGCVEHRGPAIASHAGTRGCGDCVDRAGGIELPRPGGPPPSIIDAFFARAAALPPAPDARRGRLCLDPTDLTVYPAVAMEGEDQALAFGLRTVPKLECCAGRCACPEDECDCGANCDGSCAQHAHGAGSRAPAERVGGAERLKSSEIVS